MVKAKVLDVCCGSKMFYFCKKSTKVIFCDNRKETTTLCDGRECVVDPDIIADFRNIPFDDNEFSVVVFDPPHLLHAGENSWLAKKYGTLPADWKKCLSKGFEECFRVLKPSGVLVFKWNSEQIPFADVIKLAPQKPLLGDQRGKTRWVVFVKESDVANADRSTSKGED